MAFRIVSLEQTQHWPSPASPLVWGSRTASRERPIQQVRQPVWLVRRLQAYRYYKQYDPYKEYGKPYPSEDRGEMVPFRRSGGPLLAVVALDAQRVTVYDTQRSDAAAVSGFDRLDRL